MEEKKLEKRIQEYNYVLAQRIIWMEEIKKILEKEEKTKQNIKENKKKIAIIYDVDGWAYHNIAKEIQKNIKEDYKIDIFPKTVFSHNIIRLMFLAKNYDLVHLLWRGMFSELESDYSEQYIRSLGLTKDEFVKRYIDRGKYYNKCI